LLCRGIEIRGPKDHNFAVGVLLVEAWEGTCWELIITWRLWDVFGGKMFNMMNIEEAGMFIQERSWFLRKAECYEFHIGFS
jgi:hypothetical protein